jgi:hypothetical protein
LVWPNIHAGRAKQTIKPADKNLNADRIMLLQNARANVESKETTPARQLELSQNFCRIPFLGDDILLK